MAHTPGPWKVVKVEPDHGSVNRFEIWAEHWPVKEANLLTVVTGQGYRPNKEVSANADLMAASPDLLAACKVAFVTLDACIRLGMLDRQVDKETREVLREAIAKAEGNIHE